ncbi:MAG: ribonuclease III [Gammaproteobacteria bacterium]
MTEQSAWLKQQINYQFNNPELLDLALTHSSHPGPDNERLEFLGDSVLGLVIADLLFRKFPGASEGELTRLRAALVKKETLADLGRKMQLGQHLKLGQGESRSGGQRRNSILGNAVESLFGAIYLDAGFSGCTSVIKTMYQDLLEDMTPDNIAKDPKTQLQELMQAKKMLLPVYDLIKETGTSHDKIFTIKCNLDDLEMSIIAEADSKRIAEQKAAALMLEMLAEPGQSD